MADENNVVDYGGFSGDKPATTGPRYKFGLNPGKTYMTKFEFNPNGGANNAEQEALDIEFTIDGTPKSYRLFPVVKAFKKGVEITDRNAPEFQDAIRELNMRVIHILKCFREEDDIKAALSRKIPDFKTYTGIVAGLLPRDFKEKPLDIFMQWQWTIGKEKDKTYLEIPNKMKHGAWVVAAVRGEWKENRKENPDDNDEFALNYTDERGAMHPFTRTGWYMNSHFAIQQKQEKPVNPVVNNPAIPKTGKSTW